MFDDRNNPIKRGNGTIEEGENSRNVLEQMRGGEFTMIKLASVQFSSVAQSCPTLQPHGLQHAGLPCPSPPPGVC